jgi:addiction module HigA family antidote
MPGTPRPRFRAFVKSSLRVRRLRGTCARARNYSPIDLRIGTAAHPGPLIAKEFVEPLGLQPESLAHHVGTDPQRLAAILNGEASFDAETAIRVARAFELPAERIVQMQVKYDLATLKGNADVQSVPLLPQPVQENFPTEALHGRLAEAADDGYGGFSWFFQQDHGDAIDDPYQGLHSLWVGDRLRVFHPRGYAMWSGPRLKNLDGRMLLPYVRFQVWIEWFYNGFRAELAMGEEHRLFVERLLGA